MTTPHDPASTAAGGTMQPGAGTAASGAALHVRTDRQLIRAAAHSTRYVLVDVVAPTVAPDPARRRPPVNLAFVLDRSGSMGGHDKLSLAKQATLEAIHRLDAQDRFAVVVYDNEIDVVLPSLPADAEARQLAAERLRHVEPRGNTALHGGWVTGCNEVAGHLDGAGASRVLLLTDGLANSGITEPEELGRQALELRSRGVTTSTFGVGRDFDEQLLQAMADNGGGNFYFIGDVAQMRDHITSEVGDTLEIVARNVVVDIALPAGAEADLVSPFRSELAAGHLRIHLGDLVSGQVVQLALAIRFQLGVIGLETEALVRLEDRDDLLAGQAGTAQPAIVRWTYAGHPANDAQDRDVDVQRFVVRLRAERGKLEALRLNRDGRYDDAAMQLREVHAALAPMAAADPAMLGVLDELDADAVALARRMDEIERKQRHFQASSLARARSVEGRPNRT